MPNNWKTYKLKEVVISANTGLDAIRRAPIVEEDTGIKCLRIQDVSQKKEFQNWGFCQVTPENYEKFSLNQGEIIIARTGNTIGVNRYISEDLKSVFNNGLIRLRTSTDQFYPKYIFYNLRSQKFKNYIQAIAYGTSTQPNMQINSLLNFELKAPPLPEQKAIASILTAIDDKIENNLAINKTLEEMAMELYKHWFVDFGPFQDGKFVDSELGMIPEGWEVKTLDDICEKIYSGGTPKTKEQSYWNGNIPWLSSGETRNRFVINTDKFITKLGLRKSSSRMAYNRDTVIASAGQGKTRGQTSLLLIDTSVNQSVIILRADKSQILPETLFVDLSMRYDEFRMISDSYSTRGSLTTKLLGNQIKLILPNIEFQKKFNDKLVSMYNQIESNLKENQTLTKLRDTLLTQLISGEVRLKEFKEQVENLV